ncbi:secondary thiamine-phosphate synthase enzyme [Parabacteroides sp. PF5-5]|uniref:secondary thiamine-phosphate synthase enzyme YjbQ n=1 Tax=unclassified Parabacteroides TaxID=2649774 RepID=UPI0024769172|nr:MULTISPECIES: secondary thiamine-phosphate synthase enzyme YjbQ [unclassified Parabacteroides]MDH6306458.1 secondary thiamine-phosphate synthase enzyme [Parabacteroides sp. PH5-39]MDH6317390.1 secondary thiamine-phosphate synthase enzyme [Parabacteroides sp. PF5-13]MDH6321169.1 secondary thiamine-phosphate synthase enzyme [Parabacteroides sp. PH5-13]MDH6324901.1 secondary thiamine-phosphate synthase enzyme [Parabacteroides sp. PH5-8]MDH6328575.1 secondary thiamine-phosphate synthase enzyme 
MTQQIEFTLPAYPYGFHLVTSQVLSQIGKLPETGILHLFIKHTSAGLTINENADASVPDDIKQFFSDWIPDHYPKFEHVYEGRDDMPAHIKSSVVGQSVSIPITNGKLNMGTWQGIYLCEFRYSGGRRKIVATILS